ncbi:tRNA glutamyl-Q(34) synthetase GluQRS [Aquicoccus porphyridii]|uniref:tRNA glutamyl-Q(34) synthetase GluQRS n=1 Tax=Aquicoccus porphyridii TaxID=1852029 RepID=A0A5A9ZW40_9RHOB|nr:tRNA glutamyl-Q(34) synthetase GluQRS [Aquicoccus porphyridii]KAA0920855.1 tRNA glutamyl-Q(34) synthetase GluQRS [Aquicoccus porphyridii]RAI56602.1 tRNA glutamyl-Q(34) synthetase GluQRS [Rhodobacteraceae bacterium AsT-22]
MTFRTRFAPSPTGPLHLGHAYSALLADDLAQRAGGECLLRIEDIDQSRSRPEWEAQIYDDLAWLGLAWPEPVMRQSDRLADYRAALAHLWSRGLLYSCSCNRRDIAAAASAPQEGGAPLIGPDGIVYPGTCRPAHPPSGPCPDAALRLDMARATALIAAQPMRPPLGFTEEGAGPDGETGLIDIPFDWLLSHVGDVVLGRRGMAGSYHLSVVLDDAAQGITHVVRGEDLFSATAIHVVLQRLLQLPTPVYHHHRLIRDEAGKRLAKRDDARAIATYRTEGSSRQDICALVGL